MRWLFLLLLMLNVFYFVWHQQEAPLRAKEILPLTLARPAQQDIRLLSESEAMAGREEKAQCLYLGGLVRIEEARAVEQRLNSLDIHSRFHSRQSGGSTVYWLAIAPESRRLVGDGLLAQLAQDFPQLKNRIMLCEGVAGLE
ncbi:hypothetical protein IFR09_23200 [Pseudomonas syringae]|nr:hypothetical protein [Pseudomonas syringae]MBD8577339.1 hypothetical protein [Pseudomonas syringae]MBD8792946.1 hypothetical protein [Pseudomonas syringae]MBD8803433.1 hypothetical protein [Pseudomonas syringae]MBD8814072.1 hypothetical protein [Pseudomonas syringae]